MSDANALCSILVLLACCAMFVRVMYPDLFDWDDEAPDLSDEPDPE